VFYLKLGGSLVTEKRSGEQRVRDQVVRDISRDVRDFLHGNDIVLAHGAGSFGHIPVAKYGLDRGLSKGHEIKASEVFVSVSRLNCHISLIMQEEGVPVVPVPARSIFYRERDGHVIAHLETISELLRRGFIPLTHGDLIADRLSGVHVLSADEIPLYLLPLGLKEVIFLTDVPGVLGPDGRVLDVVSEDDVVKIESRAAKDVTGSMLGKLSRAFQLAHKGVKVIIAGYYNRGDLKRILDGEVGTKIVI